MTFVPIVFNIFLLFVQGFNFQVPKEEFIKLAYHIPLNFSDQNIEKRAHFELAHNCNEATLEIVFPYSII